MVTASDNNSLFDNQGAVPNLTAPGADRYRILLTIATKSELSASDNFVHVATVKEGVIYNAVDPRDGYNIPNKVVAQRIFENSGDYFVKPFKIKFEEDSDNTKLKFITNILYNLSKLLYFFVNIYFRWSIGIFL